MSARVILDLAEAIALLSTCRREELQDHAFGDAEVYWRRDGEDVAVGYFGLDAREVQVLGTMFRDADADALRSCGIRGRVERNDASGRRSP